MAPTGDAGLDLAREAADDGLEQFKATLSFYESNPDPAAKDRRHHGVALPGMGRKPGSGGPGLPKSPPRPGKPAVGRKPSSHDEKKWQKQAEQIALQEMMKARRDFVESLFKGAQIRYKGGQDPGSEAREAAQGFAKQAQATAKSTKKDVDKGRSWTAQSHAPGQGKGAGAAELGRKVFRVLGQIDPAELADLEGPIMELAGDVFADLGASLAPFVGTAKAGVKAGSKWYKTGKKQHAVKKTGAAKKVLIHGDPEKAIVAVKKGLERERNQLAAEAGIATAKLGTDVAGYFVDLGIASSIATACASIVGELTLKVRVLIRDARELKAGNKLLQAGKLDAEIFSACPLLGAYAVAGADTSALVGFLGGDPQRHGFTLDSLEKLVKKHNEPLVKNATGLIRASRLEVTGMPTDRAAARARAGGADRGLKQRITDRVKKALGMSAPRR